MQLSPRYDGPPVLRFDLPAADVAVALVRQRRRLGRVLDQLDDAQWGTASRCDGWTVLDVVAHLVGTDQFWVLSANEALAGRPTQFLAGFDPVATPAQMVAAARGRTPAEVLADYHAGVDALGATYSGLAEDQWSLPAEAPPGHIALHSTARHALWDAWIHERDIIVPLGRAPVEEPDEVRICLGYVAALGPAFLVHTGFQRAGTLCVDGTDPPVHLVIQVGETTVVSERRASADAVVVRGPSVELTEAFSLRAPFPNPVPAQDRWLVDRLGEVFDAAG